MRINNLKTNNNEKEINKVYGFAKENEELVVITRECSDGYPITDIDNDDLRYIFKYSDIYKKILNKEYDIVEKDEI